MTGVSGLGNSNQALWNGYSGSMTAELEPGAVSAAGIAAGTFENDDESTAAAAGPKVETEADQKAAEAEMQRKAALTYIALYLETNGAPEEKNQARVPDEPDNDDESEEEKARRGKDPDLFLNTIGETYEDPDDPDKVHVMVKQIDEEGKAKYTRSVTIDNGGSGGGEPVGEPSDGAKRASVLDNGSKHKNGQDGSGESGEQGASENGHNGTGIFGFKDEDEVSPGA